MKLLLIAVRSMGDMTIPIAHALKVNNRSDVIVYAIDPSPEKCKYIEFLADINNFTNVKVICCDCSKKCKIISTNTS